MLTRDRQFKNCLTCLRVVLILLYLEQSVYYFIGEKLKLLAINQLIVAYTSVENGNMKVFSRLLKYCNQPKKFLNDENNE